MFEFNFKRKVLSKIVSVVTAFSIFTTIGFSNCLAIPDAISDYDRAMLFGEYVINRLDKINLSQSLEIDTSKFSTCPKKVYKYDDKKIINKNETKELIEDKIVEQDVYKEIEEIVKNLMSKLDEKTDIKKAAVIYEWVVRNIKYDRDSEKLPIAATQSAFCAFKYKKSMCNGFSKLLQMMMRLAGIPCKSVYTHPNDEKMSSNHAFNAIYLKDGKRDGWTLIDSTWASCALHDENKKDDDSEIFKKFFPALDKNQSLEESNKSIMCMKSHQIKCIKNDVDTDGHAERFGTGAILMSSYIGHLRLMYIPGPVNYTNGYTITISEKLSDFKTPIIFEQEEERFERAVGGVFVEGNVEIEFEECNKEILNDIKDKLNFTRSNIYKFDEKNKNKVIDKRTEKEVFDFSKVVVENQ